MLSLIVQFLLLNSRYNNKTYRVDDIDWEKRPRDTFEMHAGARKSYVDYYSSVRVLIKSLQALTSVELIAVIVFVFTACLLQ